MGERKVVIHWKELKEVEIPEMSGIQIQNPRGIWDDEGRKTLARRTIQDILGRYEIMIAVPIYSKSRSSVLC